MPVVAAIRVSYQDSHFRLPLKPSAALRRKNRLRAGTTHQLTDALQRHAKGKQALSTRPQQSVPQAAFTLPAPTTSRLPVRDARLVRGTPVNDPIPPMQRQPLPKVGPALLSPIVHITCPACHNCAGQVDISGRKVPEIAISGKPNPFPPYSHSGSVARITIRTQKRIRIQKNGKRGARARETDVTRENTTTATRETLVRRRRKPSPWV